MTQQSDTSLVSIPKVSNTPFTSLANPNTQFSFDDRKKLSTFNDDSGVAKLANVAAQSLKNQVSKTQDVITQPFNSNTSTTSPVSSNSPNDKLIAGKILAEARSATKGISPTVNNINIATGAINELSKLKDSSEIYQKASQTEKDGKVTDNISSLVEGGQKVAQGVIDLMVPLLKGAPGVSIVGNDTINFGANRGISINSRGAITNVSPQVNTHTSLHTTTSEISIEKVGLKSQESETRVNATNNNIDKSINNVQIHSSVETISNNYTLYSKDLIQTATDNKLDSFVRGETQGNDFKYSIDNTMLYTIGETFTLGVGDAPSNQEKKPGFNIDNLLDTVTNGKGGALLTISPSLYSLQHKGKVSVQSSGLQSNVANKIANIATEKIVNMSKQDVLSLALGSEFRIGSSTGYSTFGGFGSTVIGNFNIIGNLMGFISGITDIAGLIFPNLDLPSELPIPNRSEKVSLKDKVKFDECIPQGARKREAQESSNIPNSIPESVERNEDTLQGSIANDLPEYKDQEILDKLQESYPEAGGLQLNKPKGKSKVEAITPETDTPLGIKSLPQTADPLQQPTTPHNTSIQGQENGTNLPTLDVPDSTTPSNTTIDSSETGTSNTSDSQSIILNKQPKNNPQPGVPKNPSSNTVSNSIKARFSPHTYIDIYKEEDYFSDLKGRAESQNSSPPKSTNESNRFPSIKDYIEKSTNLNPEQKEKISNNLKVITDVLSNENSTAQLSIALQTKVKGLNEVEIKEIVDSYLELNAAMAVGFGFLGDIGAFFQEVTSVVTDVYEQVDKAASVFGLDIGGGVIGSVMDIVNKVKSASNASSISEVLSSLGTNFDEFMPITTSLLGLLDGSKGKDDVVGALTSSLSQVISPLLSNIGMNSVITDTLLSSISGVITNGTIMNRDKGDILNRLISILSSSGIIPTKAFEIANILGNVVDGIQEGSFLPSLLGSGVNTLFSTLTNAIDLDPINKILKNINSIYGTVESLLAIPSMLEAMNDYDIPLLSQISSIIDCVDVFSRLKDIVGIIKDPIGYEPQHTESSLNLPTDLSIDNLKNILTEKIVGKESPIGNAITSGGTLEDFLSDMKSGNGLEGLVNRFMGGESFFLLPEGNSAYLQSGEQIDSSKFLINTKGDVLITDKDNICTLEDTSLVSNKDVVALDLPTLNSGGEGGILSSTTNSINSKYIPEFKSREYINNALQAGDLEPIAIKDKATNSLYTVDIGIKNNPELITQLSNKASVMQLKDPISNEEFIWSEVEKDTIPNYTSTEELQSEESRTTSQSVRSIDVKGLVQHTKGTCKASIVELFQMIDRLQSSSTCSLLIRTDKKELNVSRTEIDIQNSILMIDNELINMNIISYVEVTNKSYKLLSWSRN